MNQDINDDGVHDDVVSDDGIHDNEADSEVASGDDDIELLSPEELLAQRDGYLNDLQRVTAEFANHRRQTAKRHQDTVAMAAAALVEKMLPVLDACDAAAAAGAQDVVPIGDALLAALQKEGLAKLDHVGESFDPNCHEAVAHEPGEGEAVIVEVLRAGYQWNSKVLRPAIVKVRG
ncbi:MAG: nucleotide exchange factor GrpE [Acidimicrobiia bacterium]|nr:nucleotide exchange factor GrpE [Acidimicrobiia bacterium]MYC57518.1 nucleotide exchange factor GrpE [Acidimicrobiia bacterium]MYG94958.1 nucleotide exchange factor GrpE [Acidimicrobiia bacterium]MYI29768.1 nucleotide exchange factor GrpE [Acidimicrobiia bacterium]